MRAERNSSGGVAFGRREAGGEIVNFSLRLVYIIKSQRVLLSDCNIVLQSKYTLIFWCYVYIKDFAPSRRSRRIPLQKILHPQTIRHFDERKVTDSCIYELIMNETAFYRNLLRWNSAVMVYL